MKRHRAVPFAKLLAMSGTPTVDLLGPLNPTELKYAPPTLWTRGDTSLLERHPRVAIVGTQMPSEDGQRRARKLVRELAKVNAVIVSGLAEGVDTIVHTETLKLGGRTIAVIGTPIDESYPPSNRALQTKIGEDNLLASEFAPRMPTGKGNFPRRNRTMALIADVSVIVEAGESSGTQSQGWEAIRLGRPLFLLKSLVESGPAWAKKMVEHGAFVLHGMTELLDVLPTDDIREAASF
jgi:DNA processing protein